MKIAIRDRRFKSGNLRAYRTIYDIDARTIDASIPLTPKVISHWQSAKNTIGFADMMGLSEGDIKSIISAVRRKEAYIDIERLGRVAFYNLLSPVSLERQPSKEKKVR